MPKISKTTVTQTAADTQDKANSLIGKTRLIAGLVATLAKGNVETCRESGKILANGLKQLSSSYADEGKTALTTLANDVKQLADITSPVDMFKRPGDLMRRNVEAAFAFGTKNRDALLELTKDTSAPLAARANFVVKSARALA